MTMTGNYFITRTEIAKFMAKRNVHIKRKRSDMTYNADQIGYIFE